MERTKKQEQADIQFGKEVMATVRGSSAEAEIEEYLQQYGLIPDKTIKDKDKAEAERHQKYVLRDNIHIFLKRYRAQKEILAMAKEELVERVETESIGALGDKEAGGSEDFFNRLCRKLDLLSAYDEQAMRRRYESRIMACRYIEEAISTLERGMRTLKAHYPESHRLLEVVYIEGTQQPTIKEAIEKLKLSGPSSYYQKLERAEQQLSGLVLTCTIDPASFLRTLVYLKQQETDGYFPHA